MLLQILYLSKTKFNYVNPPLQNALISTNSKFKKRYKKNSTSFYLTTLDRNLTTQYKNTEKDTMIISSFGNLPSKQNKTRKMENQFQLTSGLQFKKIV